MAERVTGKTVTKKDLILRIAENSGHKQSMVRSVIQSFIDEIIDELVSGNRLELRDFGVFEVRKRHSRKARNPKTGEQVDVPPKRIVTIKPGKKMKDLIHAMPADEPAPVGAQSSVAAAAMAGGSAASGIGSPNS